MNNVKNTIGWADYTWNPITGCLGGCEYCYARRIYQRFDRSFRPQIHHDRLSEPFKLKKTSRIFVCSVADFWGKGVPQMWREEVYNVIKAYPGHKFLILTKCPENIGHDDMEHCPTENVWIGITAEAQGDLARRWHTFKRMKGYNRFVSVEPLLGPINSIDGLQWVIVGAMTGAGAIKPKKEWAENIVELCKRKNVPLFLKSNLKWPQRIQEWPEGLR